MNRVKLGLVGLRSLLAAALFLGVALSASHAQASESSETAAAAQAWQAVPCVEGDENPCYTFDHDGAELLFVNDTGRAIRVRAVRRNASGGVVEVGARIGGGDGTVAAGATAVWTFQGLLPSERFIVERI